MKKTLIIIFVLCAIVLIGCRPKEKASEGGQESGISILVFITGVTAGSPPYEMLAEGATEFAAENNGVTVKVYEAGFNQAEWEEQLRSLVSGGEYDLVLGSNPSLPEICAAVGTDFPAQKFAVTDAWYEGNPGISTWMYNQYEQSLFLGYLAGLVTTSGMPRTNDAGRIGFVAAQEYPLLTKHMVPGFLEGARRAAPGAELDFRVIGNWYDANKAAELVTGMINSGCDVFTSIAGGAAQGVIRAVTEGGVYAVNFNTNDYSRAPGHIIGCGLMEQKKLTKEILAAALAGNITYGTAKTVGVKEGYLRFISDDPGYTEHLPAEIKEKFTTFMDDLYAGRIEYTVPPL